MATRLPLLLFTDLDGTLLDHYSYEWQAASEALELARAYQVPVIINTSKTLAECRALQEQLQLQGPVIFENGAGVALPAGWPAPEAEKLATGARQCTKAFAMPYARVRQALQAVRDEQQFKFTGFGDMTVSQVSQATGLPLEAAANARSREFDEPIVWQESEQRLADFESALQPYELTCTRGGRFMHVAGAANKGNAMLWLVDQYSGPRPCVVALGDSENDLPMLSRADVAVLVRSPAHKLPSFPDNQQPRRVLITDDCGPAGWGQVVVKLLEEFARG